MNSQIFQEIHEMTQPIIPAGQLFLASQGEYDEFRIVGIYRTMKDVDPETIKDLLPDWTPAMGSSAPKNELEPVYWAVMDKLVELGFVERTPVPELYLGEYGSVSARILPDPGGRNAEELTTPAPR